VSKKKITQNTSQIEKTTNGVQDKENSEIIKEVNSVIYIKSTLDDFEVDSEDFYFEPDVSYKKILYKKIFLENGKVLQAQVLDVTRTIEEFEEDTYGVKSVNANVDEELDEDVKIPISKILKEFFEEKKENLKKKKISLFRKINTFGDTIYAQELAYTLKKISLSYYTDKHNFNAWDINKTPSLGIFKLNKFMIKHKLSKTEFNFAVNCDLHTTLVDMNNEKWKSFLPHRKILIKKGWIKGEPTDCFFEISREKFMDFRSKIELESSFKDSFEDLFLRKMFYSKVFKKIFDFIKAKTEKQIFSYELSQVKKIEFTNGLKESFESKKVLPKNVFAGNQKNSIKRKDF
jgi:hypothetical protein